MRMKIEIENELLTAAQDGDMLALGELCEFHRKYVCMIFANRWKLAIDAEDFTQDAFAEVVKRIRKFRRACRFSTSDSRDLDSPGLSGSGFPRKRPAFL